LVRLVRQRVYKGQRHNTEEASRDLTSVGIRPKGNNIGARAIGNTIGVVEKEL